MNRKQPSLLQRFLRDRRGNVFILFAVGAFVFVAIAGSAVDFNRRATMNVRLQDAADATCISTAAIRNAGGGALTDAERVQVANRYFALNVPPVDGGTIRPTAAITAANGGINLRIDRQLNTDFIRFVGVNTLNASGMCDTPPPPPQPCPAQTVTWGTGCSGQLQQQLAVDANANVVNADISKFTGSVTVTCTNNTLVQTNAVCNPVVVVPPTPEQIAGCGWNTPVMYMSGSYAQAIELANASAFNRWYQPNSSVECFAGSGFMSNSNLYTNDGTTWIRSPYNGYGGGNGSVGYSVGSVVNMSTLPSSSGAGSRSYVCESSGGSTRWRVTSESCASAYVPPPTYTPPPTDNPTPTQPQPTAQCGSDGWICPCPYATAYAWGDGCAANIGYGHQFTDGAINTLNSDPAFSGSRVGSAQVMCDMTPAPGKWQGEWKYLSGSCN